MSEKETVHFLSSFSSLHSALSLTLSFHPFLSDGLPLSLPLSPPPHLALHTIQAARQHQTSVKVNPICSLRVNAVLGSVFLWGTKEANWSTSQLPEMGRISSISPVMVGVNRDLKGQTTSHWKEIQWRLNKTASYSITVWSIWMAANISNLLHAAKTAPLTQKQQ